MSLRQRLESRCEHVEPPLSNAEPALVRGHVLSDDALAVLRQANGFVLRGGLFRMFGLRPETPALDLTDWNGSPWVAEYGRLAHGLVFIAEDVFGDQYALRFEEAADRPPQLVKFWCEGGEIEEIVSDSLASWLADSVMVEPPLVLDTDLAQSAFELGLRPSLTEHLGFALPLVTGGAAELDNLELIDRGFHLHLLGQVSRQARAAPEGARITRFRPTD